LMAAPFLSVIFVSFRKRTLWIILI
jgi:hypothetical protein